MTKRIPKFKLRQPWAVSECPIFNQESYDAIIEREDRKRNGYKTYSKKPDDALAYAQAPRDDEYVINEILRYGSIGGYNL